ILSTASRAPDQPRAYPSRSIASSSGVQTTSLPTFWRSPSATPISFSGSKSKQSALEPFVKRSTEYSPNVPKAAVPGPDQFPHSPKKDKSALHLLKEHPEAKS